VILEVHDPDGFAASADQLVIYDELAAESSTARALDGHAFPMTVTLASPRKGDRSVVVEAHGASGELARGQELIRFEGGATGTAQLVLFAPCTDDQMCAELERVRQDPAARASCQSGRCALSICGNGEVEAPNEDCEDGNDNPNDGCHTCLETEWTVRTIVGLGESGGDPLATVLDTPHALAIDRDDNLYIADGPDRILRLDGETNRLVRVVGRDVSDLAIDGSSGGSAPAIAGEPLKRIRALAVDGLGTLFVVDRDTLRSIDPTTGAIETIAGRGSVDTGGDGRPLVPLGDGGPPISANFYGLSDVAVDGAGNIFLADRHHHRVRRIDPAGTVITTFAGDGLPMDSGDGGRPEQAGVAEPLALAVNADELFIAQADRVRRVRRRARQIETIAELDLSPRPSRDDPTRIAGPQLTIAGNRDLIIGIGNALYRWDRRSELVSQVAGGAPVVKDVWHGAEDLDAVDGPEGLVARSDGALIMSEPAADRVRLIDTAWTASMIVGAGRSARPGDQDTARAVAFQAIGRLATNADGTVFFAELSPHQRLFSLAEGRVRLLAGTVGRAPLGGDGGAATQAQLGMPMAIAARGTKIFVGHNSGTGTDGWLRVVDIETGRIDAISMERLGATGLDVSADGEVIAASDLEVVGVAGRVHRPIAHGPGRPDDVSVAADGSIYVVVDGLRVMRVDAGTGAMTTIAGNGQRVPAVAGLVATDSPLALPSAVAVGPGGAVFIAERETGRVLQVDAAARISVFAGGGSGLPENVDARTADLGEVYDVHVAPSGDVLIASRDRGPVITRVDRATGRIVTLLDRRDPAGDGPLSGSVLSQPAAILSLGPGRWLVADTGAQRLRVADTGAGLLSTYLGRPRGSPEEGTPPRAFRLLERPLGLALDSAAQRVFVSEVKAGTILSVPLDPTLGVRRVAGREVIGQGEGDAPGPTEERLYSPSGVAYDPGTNRVFFAESERHVIRRFDVTPREPGEDAGVSVFAGKTDERGVSGDGGPAGEATLNSPEGVALAPDGSLYIADTGNHVVRRVAPDGRIETVLGDGVAASTGAGGRPAAAFSIDTPLGLVVDAWGNLFVTSRATVRRVSAGADGVATGEDEVATIYGADRGSFPEAQTACLSGIALEAKESGVLAVTDSCQGLLLELTRTP